MKHSLLAFALVALISTAAHANPSVDEQVTYGVSSAVFNATATLSIKAYDPDKNQYLEHSEMNFIVPELPTQKSDNWLPASSFITDAQIADDLANCAQKGGKLETVKVPAGSFQACTLASETSCPGTNCVASIAKVPMGIARLTYDAAGGIAVTMELQSALAH